MAVNTRYINLASGETLSFSVMRNGHYIESAQEAINLIDQIRDNSISSLFRIFILYDDETIKQEIPQEDIKLGGSYSENYQNGQRRTLSFTLYNHSGQYNPDINFLPVGTRLRLEMGTEFLDGTILWITKGIFVVNSITTTDTPQGREVNISCGDKFSLFEGLSGKLPSAYEVQTGADIKEVLQSLLLMDMGNGVVFDSKEMIYYHSFEDKKTQCSFSKNAGETIGSLILELTTQLSAEIFYNANGNLVVIPNADVVNDDTKPLLCVFNTEEGDISQLSFNIDYNQIINKIIVIGNSSTGGVFEAVALNDNAASPYCYQKIGYRTGNIIHDSVISSQYLAQERADYELRMQMILKTSTTANILFNPLLEVNNLIAITDPFFDLVKERFLLQSISCSLDYSNQMTIVFSNLNNLPFTVR